MSIGYPIITKIGYNVDMTIGSKGPTAAYLEREWLKWMGINGRNNQKEMAAILGISQPYFNMLLEGKKTKIKYGTCARICQVFGNYDLMEIQGYERPDIIDLLNIFAPEMRDLLKKWVNETQSRGIPMDSPEADKIFRDELSGLLERESSKEKPL